MVPISFAGKPQFVLFDSADEPADASKFSRQPSAFSRRQIADG
jgi:hypothetical protein